MIELKLSISRQVLLLLRFMVEFRIRVYFLVHRKLNLLWQNRIARVLKIYSWNGN